MPRRTRPTLNLAELTPGLREVLDLVAMSSLAPSLYLTGGTALRTAYLHHRASIDLDFFSRDRIPLDNVLSLFKEAGFGVLDATRVHDRWELTVLAPGGERVRAEFVHYAFDRVAPSEVRLGALEFDSLRDILANKLTAVVDRFEAKDYADILLILRGGASLRRGMEDACAKFGWGSLDVLLQQAFVRASRLTMWPVLTPPVTLAEAQAEFRALARCLIVLPEDP